MPIIFYIMSVLTQIVHSLCFILTMSEGGIVILVIDLRNPKPIYEQIKDNIKQLIVSGALKQDEKLPSVRELAQLSSINPNTIQKSLRDLEAEGFIYTVTGRGNFVASSPRHYNPGKVEELKSTVRQTVGELYFLGVSREEIDAVIDEIQYSNKEDNQG